ncbi:endonuclease [Carboxylicivirga sp. A043]|uniref:endonuclease/exonuclease/phosphatase family protein n=1 Tax=Carboxylicivirga litoralis TaxID=2816963 RepID=UPI0021CAF156|nr:endonuclease/exonuclease/phosphatase family protein [Carboxylicivirga sp. A043]MCU4157622.1 endonuclease [Carboxylicivirga sp. A043]
MPRLLYITLLLIVFTGESLAQADYAIMFYNVENLFDCEDDSLKFDEEFLPNGNKHWSNYRLYNKIKGISKTILAANQWNSPAIIGLCEIENENTLKKLIYSTGLSNLGYRYIHYESMDKRGIDVALLYKKGIFNLLSSAPIPQSDSTNHFYTRDALYVKGVIATDTLHIVVNHWPSKRGGELASEIKRERVAQAVTIKIDSIRSKEKAPKLVVLGDFNAELNAPSIKYLLAHSNLDTKLKLSSIRTDAIQGSHKYLGHWSLIDHLFLSADWLSNPAYSFDHKIVNLPNLLEDDKTYSGLKPRRTYAGPRYIGGVSDHLPVIVNIKKK